jgi:surfactin synthase thioesterase subunit
MEGDDRQGMYGTFTIEELASIYTAMIRDEPPHGPYQLLGFSMGGVIAYGAAEQLRRAARPMAMANTLLKGAIQPDGALPSYLAAVRAYLAQTYPRRALLSESDLAQRYNLCRGSEALVRGQADLLCARLTRSGGSRTIGTP